MYLDADDKSDEDGKILGHFESEASAKMIAEADKPASGELIAVGDTELCNQGGAVPSSSIDVSSSACEVCSVSTPVVQTVADPISSKLAAVHHVSQAIKSLRWMRQLQSTEPEVMDQFNENHDRPPSSFNVSLCACGDADCIEVCDIREWLPTSKLDNKLWKLVLLLGESYLALAEAYKEDDQLHQALKVIQLACSVYGSMPSHLEDAEFISSMVSCSSLQRKHFDINENTTWMNDVRDETVNGYLTIERKSSTYLFWAKAWALVGDVYIEFHRIKGNEIAIQDLRKPTTRELRMSSEVVKEVKRLKKKLVQLNQNCSSCSLVNCSCQSDRANSGSSASSSGADVKFMTYGRKHSKRSSAKNANYLPLKDPGDECIHNKENRKVFDGKYLEHNNYGENQTDTLESSKIEVESLAAMNSRTLEGSSETDNSCSNVVSQTEFNSKETAKVKNGGIFEYLDGPLVGDVEYNLLATLKCYEEARKALLKLPSGLSELQSVVKKKGWVCNELGRIRLENKELNKAELAFIDAIDAFKEVSDHTNIILINCNLGHGRRALAEEMVSKIENFKLHSIFHNAYNHALETAKLEYKESLRYYGAARVELSAIDENADLVTSSLRNEVHTQFANTYLRLGMLLARENSTAEVYENGSLEDTCVSHTNPHDRKARKELRKHEISANEAIREALSVYESLGELRKQEAAYTYFQLACYQRDCCLKFMDSGNKKGILSKGENNTVQRVKQYASLAEWNWQKALDFYGPKTHPNMYLTILMERSALSLSLSSHLHSSAMLESALAHMLEGRHVSDTDADTFSTSYPELHAKYWSQLQMLLKKMLATTLSSSANKSSPSQSSSTPSKFGDGGKIRELYKMSLKGADMVQLHAMYGLWIS